MLNKQQKTSQFLKTKQRLQATAIENLSFETGWQIHTLLIEDNGCTIFENLIYGEIRFNIFGLVNPQHILEQ